MRVAPPLEPMLAGPLPSMAQAAVLAIGLALISPCLAQDRAKVEIFPNLGHSGIIKDVALSPDSRILASGSDDRSIRLWDFASGSLLRVLRPPVRTLPSGVERNTGVCCLRFSPDGRTLVSAGADGYVNFWDLSSGELQRAIEADKENWVWSLAISVDGRFIVTGSGSYSKGFVKLWDFANGSHIRTLAAHTAEVDAVAFSPDGRLIVSGGRDKKINLWNAASGALERSLAGLSEGVKAFAFSPDGKVLLSGSAGYDSGEIKFWDTASGRAIRTIANTGSIYSLAFSGDGRSFIAGGLGTGDRLQLLDAESGQLIRTFSDSFGASRALFTPDGRYVAGISDSKSLRVWDVSTGLAQRTFTSPDNKVGLLRDSPIRTLQLSRDGRTFVSSAFRSADVFAWSTASGRLLDAFGKLDDYDYQTNESLAFSPDGARLAAGNDGGQLKLIDPATARMLQARKAHEAADLLAGINGIAFSRDGKTLVSASDDRTVRLWDVASGKQLQIFKDRDKFHSVLFLADGRSLVSSDDGYNLTRWDIASGRKLQSQNVGLIKAMAISPDGRTFVTSDVRLTLWDASTGKKLRSLRTKGELIYSVAYSPDGSKIVAGTSGHTIELWDVASGRNLVFPGHDNTVSATVFSSDGRTIISGSWDTTIRRWSLTGELLAISLANRTGQQWLTITPEGFFDGAGDLASLINVVRGLEKFGLDQFYQSLYRPDLVREKLAGDPRGLVRASAAQLNLETVIASGSAPEVRLRLPSQAIGSGAIDGSHVVAEAEIVDRGGGIGRIEWRINGVTAGIDTPPAGAGSPLRLSRNLALDSGSNNIEVVAYNRANLVASAPAKLTVVSLATSPPAASLQPPASGAAPSSTPAAAAKPRLFVLVAGVNDYAEKRIKLSYAVSDARDIARGFEEASGNLYSSVEVKLMTDAEVNRDKLDAAFAEMAGKTSTSDMFILYLAGHGKTVDGRYYFIPQNLTVDGEFNDSAINAAVKARGIAQDQWQKWFASVPARRSVILFDTCDSGTLAGDETQELERSVASDRLAQATGRSILAASGSTQEAIEGYRGHGLFTYNVLDAIYRSDGDNSGTVELNELAAYVYGQVSELSLKVFKQRQVPQMRLTGNYPLAKPTRILMDDVPLVAENKPAYQVAQNTQLQVQPGAGSTVVRSLSANTKLTVLESKNGWSLVAKDGKPIGYVASRDLAPAQ